MFYELLLPNGLLPFIKLAKTIVDEQSLTICRDLMFVKKPSCNEKNKHLPFGSLLKVILAKFRCQRRKHSLGLALLNATA